MSNSSYVLSQRIPASIDRPTWRVTSDASTHCSRPRKRRSCQLCTRRFGKQHNITSLKASYFLFGKRTRNLWVYTSKCCPLLQTWASRFKPYILQLSARAGWLKWRSRFRLPTQLAICGPSSQLNKFANTFCPEIKEDVKLPVPCCAICQKQSDHHKTRPRSLVDWWISYHFHHIRLDFLATRPFSKGNQYILLLSEVCTKW